MHIVEQVARMVDPCAFMEWESNWGHSELDKARTAYNKSKARHLASQILKLACSRPDLKQELVEHELQGWRELDVPVDHPDLREVVESKFR